MAMLSLKDADLYYIQDGNGPDIVWIFSTFRDIQIPVRFEEAPDDILKDIEQAAVGCFDHGIVKADSGSADAE